MSRSCGWCSHPQRSELERRLASGESIRVVATDAGYSESAAQRHLRNHVQASLFAQASIDRWHEVVDFADRLHELMDDSTAVRMHAKEGNDPRLLLHAIREERDTVAFIINRLGIDGTEMTDYVRQAGNLVKALNRVLASEPPGLTDALADSLHDIGDDDLASAYRKFADGVRQARVLAVASTSDSTSTDNEQE